MSLLTIGIVFGQIPTDRLNILEVMLLE